MTIDLLLAICVVILAALCLGIVITQDHRRRNLPDYKFLYESLVDDCREWETRAQDNAVFRTEAENENARLTDAYQKLKGEFWYEVGKEVRKELDSHANQMAVKLAPDSHNVQQTDVEGLILNSPDPVWQFISDNRDLLARWELKNPEVAAALPHYRYSQFATWLANFCEGHFNRNDVERAIDLLKVDSRG